MKKSARILSALLAALMLAAIAVVPVSAKWVWVEEKTEVYVPVANRDPAEVGTVFVSGGTVVTHELVSVKDEEPAGFYWSLPTSGTFLKGGSFIKPKDAQKELEDYLDRYTFDINMREGDTQVFCSGAYFVCEDPSIAYYDYKTGSIVAKSYGTTRMNVYTQGGIPMARLNVYVYRKFGPVTATKPDTLTVTPGVWNLPIGGETTFTVTSACGKTYSDLRYKIVKGWDFAFINEKTGKLSGDHNGVVLVQAYSKATPDVCGSALLYVGSLTASVCEGGWSLCPGGIKINTWNSFNFFDPRIAAISGWIKSAEGLLIPILRIRDAVKTNPDGSTTAMKVLTAETVSYLDLLRMAYGDKVCFKAAVTDYNSGKTLGIGKGDGILPGLSLPGIVTPSNGVIFIGQGTGALD